MPDSILTYLSYLMQLIILLFLIHFLFLVFRTKYSCFPSYFMGHSMLSPLLFFFFSFLPGLHNGAVVNVVYNKKTLD